MPMYELRSTLENLKQIKFHVGSDNRNRAGLRPYAAKTGRNCPKASEYVFGPARWVRSLIKPEEGTGLAYIDWSQQEFAIAAAFSGDEKMLEVYASDDPYIEFAKLAGAVPAHATKASHKKERGQFKECMLGVNYGMGARSLAGKINGHVLEAESLLRTHAMEFATFTDWINRVPDHILVHGTYQTPFGWTGRPGREPRLRSLRNFPLQAAGADIMRVAACGIVEAGIKLLAPVHDAFLIEAPLDQLDKDIVRTQEIMAEAGAAALGGLRLKTDVDTVTYPDRYMDERGGETWKGVLKLLEMEEDRCV
jgi:DNA polymerase I-like protein with 3'-5' exonuclease and polymerase domains